MNPNLYPPNLSSYTEYEYNYYEYNNYTEYEYKEKTMQFMSELNEFHLNLKFTK